MSDVMERVADAIFRQTQRDMAAFNVAEDPDRHFNSLARAAISAMREPTEAMTRAGLDSGEFGNGVFEVGDIAAEHV